MTKQQRLPGTKGQHHRDITKAAKVYVDVRDRRMGLNTQEIEKRDVLLTAMRKHKLALYEDIDAGLAVEVVKPDEKVKVRKLEDEGEE